MALAAAPAAGPIAAPAAIPAAAAPAAGPAAALALSSVKPADRCSTPGCHKPSWNLVPGEYCSRACRDGQLAAIPKMLRVHLQDMHPGASGLYVRIKGIHNGMPMWQKQEGSHVLVMNKFGCWTLVE